MRVLHTIPGLNWGGMEYRVIEQVAWLNANGHQAWLATPEGGESMKRAREMGLPVVAFDFERPWRSATVRSLRALLKDLKIDVADAHVTRDAKALMACLDLVAVVRSRHITQRLKPGFVRALQWRLGADGVIAVAGCIAKAMQSDGLVSSSCIDVVGEWADDTFFEPALAGIRESLRGELRLAAEDVAVACIGMLRPEKGQDVLLDALRELPERYKLLMIGSATGEGLDFANALKEQEKRLGVAGRVRWLGYRNDIPALLAASDIVAVPSFLEAQSRAVPQAFAAGKPVVATRVGGLPELVQEGVTGLLVPPRDAFALASAIRKLDEDKALSSGCVERAKAFALARLRFSSCMQATVDIYAKALERARRRSYLPVRRS